MKFFYTLSYFLILLIAFSSCEKIKDAVTEDFYTTISMEIPVIVEDTTTIAKSGLVSYSFSASKTVSLEDNENVTDYLDLIKKIEITDVNIVFSGLTDNQVIEKIDISVEGVGMIASIENITPSELNFHPDVNSSLLILVANKLYLSKQLTVTVEGTSNEAPMDFTVNSYFNLHIEARPG